MSDAPTPETDGLETHKAEAVCLLVVPSIFARRLERERDEARRERDEALHRISVWHSGQVPNEDKEEAK